MAAVVAGLVAAGGRQAAGTASYVCPMHPEVTASTPADCPLCHMALERKSHPSHSSLPLVVEAAAEARPGGEGNATPAAFACPMHPDVTSPRPAKCRVCKMPLERKASQARGTEGAPIFSFHDVTRARPRPSSRDMRGPARIDEPGVGTALLFLDECKLLRPGEGGVFFPNARPRDGAPAGVAVRLLDEAPAAWDGSTALVRFEVRDPRAVMPKQTGWLKLDTRIRNDIAIPSSAVIQSPEGPYVLVLSEGLRSVAKRPIKIGSVLFGYAAVIEGLADGERVAAMRTFSLDVLRKEMAR